MNIIARFFLLAVLVGAAAACTSSGVGDGSSTSEGVDSGEDLEVLGGEAAAVACTSNADCAGVFEATGCLLAACDTVEQHCSAIPKSEGTACEGVAAGCGGVGQGVCDAAGACAVDETTITEGGCDDSNPCTFDDCHAELGCLFQFLPDGESCDDGDTCTVHTSCVEGVCAGEAIPDCEPHQGGDGTEPGEALPVLECLEASCSGDYDGCMNTDGCPVLLECLDGCESGDDVCDDACFESAEDEAIDAVFKLWICGQAHTCFDVEDGPDPVLECVASHCGESYYACLSDNPCLEMLDCFDDCEDDDQACSQECFDDAPQTAKQLYSDIYACVVDEGCLELEPEQGGEDPDDPVLECIADACPELFADCLADQGCSETVDCLTACGEDEQCSEGCLSAIPPMSQLLFFGLAECVESSGCIGDGPGGPPDGADDPVAACLEDVCDSEWSGCMNSAGCTGLIQCMEECPEGDEDCNDDCFEDASPNAQGQWWGLVQCGSNEGCFEEGPGEEDPVGQCLLAQCGTEYENCVFSGGGCVGIFECMDECPEDDSGCTDDCFEEASPDAQGAWWGLIQCGSDNGCFEQDPGEEDPGGEEPEDVIDCLKKECGSSLEDCVEDEDCAGISPCLDTCEEDPECEEECFQDAGEGSVETWWAVILCGSDNGCFEEDPGGEEPGPGPVLICLQEECNPSLEACIDDEDCAGISPCLDTCEEDPGCEEECFEDAGEDSVETWWTVVNCGADNGCFDPAGGPETDPQAFECILASCEVGEYTDLPGGKAVLNCIAACEDALCAEDCAKDAPGPTKNFASEAAACAVDAGCLDETEVPATCGNGVCEDYEDGKSCPEDCNEPDSPNSCIKAQCQVQIEACEDTGACGEAFACWSAPGCDQGCKFQCLNDLGDGAEQSFEEVLSCGDAHGCFDGPPPDGEAECGNDVCEKGEDGFNCPADCKPPDGGEGPGGPGPDPENPDETLGDAVVECALDACEEEVGECLQSGACAKILTCISLCDDEECLEDCVAAAGFPPGEFWPMVQCSDEAGCGL